MGGRGDMEGRVARVDVVTYRDEEVGLRIMAARSDLKRTGGQARILLKHPLDLGPVTSGDCREERKLCTLIELVGSRT
jgi:hypothetical protein